VREEGEEGKKEDDDDDAITRDVTITHPSSTPHEYFGACTEIC